MNPFSRRHPLAILCYYMAVFALVLWMGHPVLCVLLFLFMFTEYCFIAGAVRTVRAAGYSMGAVALCVVINPLLNHRGVTVLFYLGDMRITEEAVLYGVYMAVVLLGSLFLFACFSSVMTSEKIMTLAGKRFPSLSLLFSMILRVVPKVRKDFQEMTAVHGNCPRVWSALVGKLMEDSVERSMAMKNRGYGSGRRTSFFRRPLQWQDWVILTVSALMVVYGIVQNMIFPVRIQFFPSVRIGSYDILHWTVWVIYLGMPLWMRGKEEFTWRLSRRRITGSIIRDR